MTNEIQGQRQGWSVAQVYALAGICLIIGVALGYLFRGSQSAPAQPNNVAQAASATGASTTGTPQMPSLDDLKRMADKQAEPLTLKLKDDPKNPDLLKQVAKIYEAAHQFKEAASYYARALDVNPKDVPARTEMASCLYYGGDIDGALAQLQQALKVDPRDANSLFNLGMIKWQAKQDATGALAAWQELLKSNPKLSADRKAQVQKLIADAQKSRLAPGQ